MTQAKEATEILEGAKKWLSTPVGGAASSTALEVL